MDPYVFAAGEVGELDAARVWEAGGLASGIAVWVEGPLAFIHAGVVAGPIARAFQEQFITPNSRCAAGYT